MIHYLIRRFIAALVTVLLAAVLVFLALLMVPGDPAEAILGINASPQAVTALRRQLGLDRPPLVRFGSWLGGVVRGDLGESLNYQRPVGRLIVERLPVSIPLALGGVIVALLIALPLGVLAALKQGSGWDPLIVLVSQLGAALPSFWLGLLLILFFSVELRWFPAAGYTRWSTDPLGMVRSMVLPVFALGLGQAAVMTRMTRAAMLEVLSQDYIRTAKAKGLPVRSTVYKHALRNALVTIITIVGLSFSQILVGSIIIEQVFSLPGLGRLALTAIGTRDFPLLQGEVLVYAAAIVILNFLVDVSYSLLDPRIRYG